MTSSAHDTDLTRLELLKAYKQIFGKDAVFNRSPFDADQVIRYDTDVKPRDVPQIHLQVRERIQEILQEVHHGQRSHVVILAGDPGIGKSHLINFFRSEEQSKKLNYVLVGNSNHWKSSEFEACLLDWIIAALVRPGPDQSHLLLDKVEDIAFQALAQILKAPGAIDRFTTPSKGGRVGRTVGRMLQRLTGDTHERFQKLVYARDPSVFRRLDFCKFSKHVCSQFLHDGGHPFHRYVLQVLLRYVFPSDREKVLHWLRGRRVADRFLKSLEASDEIDMNYKVVDALKVVISLFTHEVAKGLSGGAKASSKLVFFFALDQPEGRDELFDSKEEWRKFFAQLSELYNCLPNVFILFTMTVALSKDLHDKVEGQFRDRIQRDHKFLLRSIEEAEVLALYEKRVDDWLADAPPELREKVKASDNRFLPFDRKQVLEFGRMRTLRDMLKTFDEEFRRALAAVATEAIYDYRVFQKELRMKETPDDPYKYVEGHLQVVHELLVRFGTRIGAAAGLTLRKLTLVEKPTPPRLLVLEFEDPSDSARWVRVHVGRLTHHWKDSYNAFVDILSHRQRNKNLLMLLRARQFEPEIPEERIGQIFPCLLSANVHRDFQAVLQVLGHESDYQPQAWKQAEEFLIREIQATYLGRMLDEVGGAIKKQAGKNSDESGAEPMEEDAAGIDLELLQGEE